MIDPAYCQMMARYNRWQNQNLIAAADTLSDAARRQQRGAFFGSIFATLNHLLWADTIWLHRFSGSEKPQQPNIPGSVTEAADWQSYCERRAAKTGDFIAWADGVTQARLDGDLVWYSGASKKDMVRPLGMMAVHVFNHQTHQRGQIHAMLTAAGAKPDDTDLMLMPADSD
jgi:uncharacterized damage-inducible protein DinB